MSCLVLCSQIIVEPRALWDEVAKFDPGRPVEVAETPPSSWYVDEAFHGLEREHVFRRGWIAVGRSDQVRERGSYFTGDVAGDPFVVIRGDDGELRGFFNVCRHHAAQIIDGEGTTQTLRCPYHGWQYDLCGKLQKAPHVGGIRDFDRSAFSMREVGAGSWGPFVFICLEGETRALSAEFGDLEARIVASGANQLVFKERRSYDLDCNWKVYVDNYLDGGYHVPVLHHALSAQLDLASYQTELFEKYSVQSCRAGEETAEPKDDPRDPQVDFAERLGDEALYIFMYPNFMINRYGPIMDTNLVLPLAQNRCRVVFNYYFDPSKADDAEFVERSLRASHQVQVEDMDICHSVQRGLATPAYETGRYAPSLEHGMYHFHKLLAQDLQRGCDA